jgi:hypothetical protein
MSARASKILRRLLAILAVVAALVGFAAFFCDCAVEFRLPGASRDGSEIWILCGSENGLFALGYRILPRVLDEAEWQLQRRDPRWHAVGAGRARLVWGSLHQEKEWWFRAEAQTYHMQLPIPKPATKPATAPVATYPMRVAFYEIPAWLFWLLAVPYPLYRLIDVPNNRRRKRFAAGQCLACGYDLRHTPDRCPECGQVPTSTPPPRGHLWRLEVLWRPRLLRNLRRGIWLRIVLYPVFYFCFSLVFSWAYFRHYQK